MVDTAPRLTGTPASFDGATTTCGVEALAGELAWCLEQFMTASADEAAMERSQRALAAWRALL